MSEYSKALLSDEVEECQSQPLRTVAAQQRVVRRMALLSVFVDAAISLGALSLWLPFSLPLWPLFAAIFLSAFYAFRRSNAMALRPLLILLMFALVLCPSLLVVLLIASVHDPFRAVRLLSVFLPFVPFHSSPFSVLLPICLTLFCCVIYFYWQLHTFWLCQQYFDYSKRWGNSKAKGYAELYVPDPFRKCQCGEKKPTQKHSSKCGKAKESAEGQKPAVPKGVVICEMLADSQVFSLGEEEAKTKQRNGGEEHEETNSLIRSKG